MLDLVLVIVLYIGSSSLCVIIKLWTRPWVEIKSTLYYCCSLEVKVYACAAAQVKEALEVDYL